MIPKTKIGQFIAVLWLIVCIGILFFAYIQQSIHDMPVAFIYLMMFISAPVGLIVAPITGIATSYLFEIFSFEYHPFLDLLPSWFAMVIIGYIQWFIALPRFISWVKSNWQDS